MIRRIKRLVVPALAGLLILLAAVALPGCSTWGNGQVDLPVDVDVVFHDNFGNGFALIGGQLEEATYRSVKTGVLYEYTTDTGKGTFQVTEPRTGAIIRLRAKDLRGRPPEGGTTNLSPSGRPPEGGTTNLSHPSPH